MSEIIEPHVAGPARCEACGRTWVAVRPLVMATSRLECPSCGALEGRDDGPVWTARPLERETAFHPATVWEPPEPSAWAAPEAAPDAGGPVVKLTRPPETPPTMLDALETVSAIDTAAAVGRAAHALEWVREMDQRGRAHRPANAESFTREEIIQRIHDALDYALRENLRPAWIDLGPSAFRAVCASLCFPCDVTAPHPTVGGLRVNVVQHGGEWHVSVFASPGPHHLPEPA